MPLTTQVLIDTEKRTVIKLVGNGGDTANTTVLNASALRGAKAGLSSWLVNVKKIIYSVQGGSVQLYWHSSIANSNTPMMYLSGSGIVEFIPESMVLNNNAVAPTGNIGVLSTGMTANSSYTVILELKKDAQYYDPGTP